MTSQLADINCNFLNLAEMKSKDKDQQECIPVGCVPPARNSTGGSLSGGLPGQRPLLDRDPLLPWTKTPQTETPRQKPSWTGTPWTETPSGQRHPLNRDPLGQRPLSLPPPQSCNLWCMLGQRPPLNRMTHRCKNITLPQLRCGR